MISPNFAIGNKYFISSFVKIKTFDTGSRF